MKELRIFIMVRDLSCDRITTYCSGKEEDENLFTFEKVCKSMIDFEQSKSKHIKMFTDNDFDSLNTCEYAKKYYHLSKK